MLNFFSHDVFTSGDLREFPGQDEVTLCQQRIISCPGEIQGVRVAMGRHEQLLPWAVTSNCRHGPSRAIPLRTCRGLRGAEEKVPTWTETCFECLDRDKTSASWSTATAMGSCIGRSRDAGRRPQLPVRRKKPSPASLLRKRQESPRVVPWHSS